MIPKLAIEKAVAGGWETDNLKVYNNGSIMQESGHVSHWEEIVLTPAFWQALGKSLGWGHDHYHLPGGMHISGVRSRYEAHRFYDLILQGKDTEAFWYELLQGN